MDEESLMILKTLIVDVAATLSVVVTCVALLLIEFWGIKKIWKLLRG
jgi:hypothetical protein